MIIHIIIIIIINIINIIIMIISDCRPDIDWIVWVSIKDGYWEPTSQSWIILLIMMMIKMRIKMGTRLFIWQKKIQLFAVTVALCVCYCGKIN